MFWKNGMYFLRSIIGINYTVAVDVCGDEGGLQYEFIDVIVEGYNGNDSIQVVSILPHVLAHVKAKQLSIEMFSKKINNHSCFSSQEHIMLIHHKNIGWEE